MINVFWDVKPEDQPLRPAPASTLTFQVRMVRAPGKLTLLPDHLYVHVCTENHRFKDYVPK